MKNWKDIFKTFYDKNENGGSSRWFVSPDTVLRFVESLLNKERIEEYTSEAHIYQCGACGKYVKELKEGMCLNCFKKVN